MPTIYQVAERAGVSLSTVSRVLNGKASVNKALKERVDEAIKELNYRPNAVARSLANNRTDSIGVLISKRNASVFSETLQALECTLRKAHKHVVIAIGDTGIEAEKEAVEFLISRNCDALIIDSETLSDEYLVNLNHTTLPTVLLDRHIEEIPDACFTFNNEKGGYLATRHLLELGHKSIAYLSGPVSKAAAGSRLTGHKRALLEAGLTVNPQLIFNGDASENDGERGLLELMARDLPFSALICASNGMASGAIGCARDLGMRLPHDLSIVGYDDMLIAHHLHPKLTAVHHSRADMAAIAATYILNKVYGQTHHIQPSFEPSLVVRESTLEFAN